VSQEHEEGKDKNMISTPPEVRAMTSDLTASVWIASALGALLESGLVAPLREPCSVDELAAHCNAFSSAQIARLLGVAEAVGVVFAEGSRFRLAPGVVPFAEPPMRTALAGDLRTNLMQAVALLDRARGSARSEGWTHVDPALLQSQGEASMALAFIFKSVLPELDDLGARLERPGASFLDVGVGVGALSIAMCRVFPALHVVGLDTFDAPLALARKNVAEAKLDARVDLRKTAAEDLSDEAAFDLAWVPAFFIRGSAAAARRIHSALRPGGWILFGSSGSGGDARRRAVWSLINELWGGATFGGADAEATLREAGFQSVRTLPGPEWAPSLTVGRR
jgi:SAM-dependent methyltransferase